MHTISTSTKTNKGQNTDKQIEMTKTNTITSAFMERVSIHGSACNNQGSFQCDSFNGDTCCISSRYRITYGKAKRDEMSTTLFTEGVLFAHLFTYLLIYSQESYISPTMRVTTSLLTSKSQQVGLAEVAENLSLTSSLPESTSLPHLRRNRGGKGRKLFTKKYQNQGEI